MAAGPEGADSTWGRQARFACDNPPLAQEQAFVNNGFQCPTGKIRFKRTNPGQFGKQNRAGDVYLAGNLSKSY